MWAIGEIRIGKLGSSNIIFWFWKITEFQRAVNQSTKQWVNLSYKIKRITAELIQFS
jgi:hypothetical protein